MTKFILSQNDKQILKSWGHKDADFSQIERAANIGFIEYNEEKITPQKAIEILGRTEFLSGLSRAAFHWSACRENEKGDSVYFDASKLFE